MVLVIAGMLMVVVVVYASIAVKWYKLHALIFLTLSIPNFYSLRIIPLLKADDNPNLHNRLFNPIVSHDTLRGKSLIS